MAERKALKESNTGGGLYFAKPSPSVDFISSGCTLMDCVLGGGWPLGRVANIVGDKSTGKTLLAIEAAANFARNFPDGGIWYREAEAAFDKSYAEALGMPLKRIDFKDGTNEEPIFTVEDLFEDMDKIIDKRGHKRGLYIVDSLDALSDRAELDRDMEEGSYGTQKAKLMSQLFRRVIKDVEESKICFIIISQVRDNIGVSFGEKHTRSGGRALDFYASQALWLSQKGILKRSHKNIERAYGIEVLARCKKNKIAMPFRDCKFPIIFGFGIDDIKASAEWLLSAKRCDVIDVGNSKDEVGKYLRSLNKLSDHDYFKEWYKVATATQKVWYEIEQGFVPERKKYAARNQV